MHHHRRPPPIVPVLSLSPPPPASLVLCEQKAGWHDNKNVAVPSVVSLIAACHIGLVATGLSCKKFLPIYGVIKWSFSWITVTIEGTWMEHKFSWGGFIFKIVYSLGSNSFLVDVCHSTDHWNPVIKNSVTCQGISYWGQLLRSQNITVLPWETHLWLISFFPLSLSKKCATFSL